MQKFFSHIIPSLVERPLRSVRSTLLCWLRQLCSGAPRLCSASSACSALCIALLCSCSWMHEDISLTSNYDYDPIMRIHSRAEGSTGENARITFWNKTSYDNLSNATLLNTVDMNPLFEIVMGDEVDAFRFYTDGDGANKENFGTPYNTYRAWPDEQNTVCVSGIGPEKAIGSNSTVDDIEIVANDGLSDIIASRNDGTSRGSFNHPFVLPNEHVANTHDPAYNEERELKFNHLLAGIKFRGRRSPDMTQRILVRDVTIEINNDKDEVEVTSNGSTTTKTVSKVAIPTSLTRYVGNAAQRATLHQYNDNNNAIASTTTHDKDPWTYVVGSTTIPAKLTANFPGDINYDVQEGVEAQEIATFYGISPDIQYGYNETGKFDPFNPKVKSDTVNGPRPVLSINIKATYYLWDNKKEERIVEWKNVVIDNWSIAKDADPTGDKFMPAHMYEVTLTFFSNSVGLRAELVPWVEEGPYYYPVLGSSEHKFSIEIFNSGNSSITPDLRLSMATPDEKLYNKVATLSNGMVIGFTEYTDLGTLEHMAPTTINPTNILELEGPGPGERASNSNPHYVYSGPEASYLFLANKITHTLTLVPTADGQAEGYYINDQKLADTYTNGGYVTTSMLPLADYDSSLDKKSTPEYHISNFVDKGEGKYEMNYLNLKDFNLGANNIFSYYPPTSAWRVNSAGGYTEGAEAAIDEHNAGDYLMIYDDNPGENNTKSLYVIRKKQNGDNLNNDVFLNDMKMTATSIEGNTVYTLYTTKIPEHGLVAITKMRGDEQPIVFTFIGTGTPGDDQLRTDGINNLTLSGNTLRTNGTGEYTFTVNLNDQTIACAYREIDPAKINTYWVGGAKIEGTTATSYLYLSTTATPYVVTYYDSTGAATTINYNNNGGWTFNGNSIATSTGSSITLNSGAGWYPVTIDTSAKTVTIGSEVANSDGAPILASPQYYNGSTPVTSPLTATLTIPTGQSSVDYTLPALTYTDNRCDGDGNRIDHTVDYSTWTISGGTGINLTRNGNTLTVSGDPDDYNISINPANTTILVSASPKETEETLWTNTDNISAGYNAYSVLIGGNDDNDRQNSYCFIKHSWSSEDVGKILRVYIKDVEANAKGEFKASWVEIEGFKDMPIATTDTYYEMPITANIIQTVGYNNNNIRVCGTNFKYDRIVLVSTTNPN